MLTQGRSTEALLPRSHPTASRNPERSSARALHGPVEGCGGSGRQGERRLLPPSLRPLHPAAAKWGEAAAGVGAVLPEARVQHGQLSQLLLLVEVLRFILRQERNYREELVGTLQH